ncbi:DUF421 domain-containing protein [Polymorphobacter multimanifer]|uniref:DUF421 domain-containing protein n=1 Tax=Polymorphobacter multimanifer TaxID=1070431 RepID=UPI0016632F12|nr:YetF domain-containing protein [Polymorphobacter multimanifer]GGI81157.1 DUF421 domain-containing protein [Polymorphobacter multimanifer]
MLFDNLQGVLRVVIMGALAYVALIAILRSSGKRTFAKMNAFDLVVTVALGSTLATILLSKDVALAEGIAALLVLVLLQYAIAAMSVRWRWGAELAQCDARTLLLDGVIDSAACRDERVTEEELRSAVRSAGHGDLDGIAAVVIETDGRFSVIPQGQAGSRSAFPARPEKQ